MSDVFSTTQRSAVMKAVKPSGNKTTEIRLLEYFREHGIKGWRRQYRVKGHPDFVFLPDRIAVFVDGCFWHGHDCRSTRPEQHKEYWLTKRQRNIQHDAEVTAAFESRGWIVIRIWECELKKKNSAILNEMLLPILERQRKLSDEDNSSK
jgi:DNA mismatch endonuclease (patch repair protein)